LQDGKGYGLMRVFVLRSAGLSSEALQQIVINPTRLPSQRNHDIEVQQDRDALTATHEIVTSPRHAYRYQMVSSGKQRTFLRLCVNRRSELGKASPIPQSQKQPLS
jgi:hypothetical protein